MAYVKKTIDYEITYHYEVSLQPVGFVNFDYTNDKNTQRPTNEYIFFVGEEPVSQSTKRQEIIAILIIEAKYITVSRAIQQAIQLSLFFDKALLLQKKPIILFIDNNSIIEMTKMY